MGVTAFNRTLEQELTALARGVSLECLVCGEFVLHEGPSIRCPECGATLRGALESAGTQLHFDVQAG
jgi:rubrerythrin